MAVIHISERDAERDFAGLLAKVRAGEEVLIDGESAVVAITRIPRGSASRKTLSEAIRRAEERNNDVTLDDQFGRDLEIIISNHQHEGIRDPWTV